MEREIICLDTSVLIDYFRKKIKENYFFYKLAESRFDFVTTAITTFEIYRGITSEQKLFWDELFNVIKVAQFDEQSSRITADLFQLLHHQNKLIAIPDLFIASIALRNNYKLATLNRKDFERIESLQILSN
jgi:predicted nucleic acid-binding protein